MHVHPFSHFARAQIQNVIFIQFLQHIWKIRVSLYEKNKTKYWKSKFYSYAMKLSNEQRARAVGMLEAGVTQLLSLEN